MPARRSDPTPVSPPRPSAGRRFRLRRLVPVVAMVLTVLVGVPVVAAAGAPVPPSPHFGKAIEGYSAYEPGTTCTLVDRPGAVKLAQLIRDTYGPKQSIGISYNACYTISEHNEGRAIDWMLDASDPADRAKAKSFFDWLFATDRRGNTDAMARRLGIMYIIWNHRMWRAYNGGVWGDYSGTNPHTDHIHISLSLDGATGRTSYWTDHPLAGPCAPTSLSGSTPAAPKDPMTFVPVPATPVLVTATGRGTVNGTCRLFAPNEYTSTPTRVDAVVTGAGGVPSTGVSAVALQVTMKRPNSASSLRAGPAGAPLPGTARVSAPLNGSSTSLLVVPVGEGGKVSFATNSGATDLTVDVVGYYRSADSPALPRGLGAGDLFRPVSPASAFSNDLAGHGTQRVVVAGTGGVPKSASAVLVDLRVAGSPGRGRVRVYPAGGDAASSTSLPYPGGHAATVQMVVPVGKGGAITVENAGKRAKPVNLDLVGGFVPSTVPGGLGFVATRRLLTVASTSHNVGLTTLDSGDTKVVPLAKHLPADARAAVLTVTVKRPAADTQLSFWAADQSTPDTVQLSAAATQTVTSTVVVPLGGKQRMRLRNVGADNVDLTAKLVGYME